MPPEEQDRISNELEEARQTALDIQDAIGTRDTQDPEDEQVTTATGMTVRGDDLTEDTDATEGIGPDLNVRDESDSVFMEELRDRLLGGAGMVSSDDTDLEASVNEAVEQAGVSQRASADAIRSRFQDAIGGAQAQGARNATQQREQSGGFGTNLAALREVTRQTDSRIADLERQREQALLQDRSDVADRISDIIVQEMELEQQARQNALSELTSASRLQQQQQQFDRRQSRLEEAQQQENAAQRIQFLANNNILDQANDEEIDTLAQQFGVPSESLRGIKESNATEIRNVSGVGLVGITTDSEGNMTTEVLQRSVNTDSGTGETDPIVEFTSSDRQALAAADIPPSDIPDIQASINQFGLETTLNQGTINGEPMTDSQKQAIRDALEGGSGQSPFEMFMNQDNNEGDGGDTNNTTTATTTTGTADVGVDEGDDGSEPWYHIF